MVELSKAVFIQNLITNISHLEAVDSSAVFQTNEENVDHDDDVDVTVSDFHNGLFSSTMEQENNESSCKDLEVQKAPQIASSPEPDKIEEASLQKNSDCVEQNSNLKTFVTMLSQALDTNTKYLRKIPYRDLKSYSKVINFTSDTT